MSVFETGRNFKNGKSLLRATRSTDSIMAGQSPEQRAALFVAAVAALTGRQKMSAHVTVQLRDRMLRLEVDTASPFSSLVRQVQDLLSADRVAAYDERRDAAIDVAVEIDSDSGLEAGDAPTYSLQRTSNQETFSITHPSSWDISASEHSLAALECLLEDAAERPHEATGRLRLIREEVARALYAELNRTGVAGGSAVPLERLKAAAGLHAARTAIVFGSRTLTYGELESRSHAIAAQLRARGADQERPVAICMERSEAIPLVQLAAWKAGSFYVPLDPGHPQQRLIDIVEECRPALVVVSQETSKLFAGIGITACLFDELETGAAVSPEEHVPAASDLAYMIYTSGTTGRPKGVMISHGSLGNLLLGTAILMQESARVLAVASFAFDISGLDIFLPLVHGATVMIAPDAAVGDPWQLMELVSRHEINFLQATPVTWRMLLTAGFKSRPGLTMLSGGEALPRDLANGLFKHGGTLWNGYGPTETTIYSSMVQVRAGEEPVTIGRPLANTRFYVVDEAGKLLPPGFAGELYIGGSGVAAGYFERPELNAERFRPDPWADPGGDVHMQPRLFRTGDLVRWQPGLEGGFEIFGRLDQQVKLRGYRIELGEIETVLRSHPGIVDAAVLLREDEPGDPWLVAYCAKQSGVVVNPVDVMEAAGKRLPRYMLPSRLVLLDVLPQTGSSKVDRRALAALPAPDSGSSGADAAVLADAIEATLLRIFREVLRSKTFGLDDDFFRFGGYSMQAVRLFGLINHSLHKQLPLTVLFEAPTVRRLAALIRSNEIPDVVVAIRPDGGEAPFFLVQSYLLYELARDVVDRDHPVFGLREQTAGKTFPRVHEQAAVYVTAINRQHPAGMVHLGGWCAAAPLTVEIARALTAQGRRVGMVALFDAEAPGFVERPARGSAWLAKAGAMWRFHTLRLRNMTWRARRRYVLDKLAALPGMLIARFYERHMNGIIRLQKLLPWLPEGLFRNNFNAGELVEVEQVQPMELPVQLFRARDVPLIAGSDSALGWREIARGGVEVRFIPGHHESMFLKPNVSVLRKEFQASMRRVEGRASSQSQGEIITAAAVD